jgi:hypothetical protein
MTVCLKTARCRSKQISNRNPELPSLQRTKVRWFNTDAFAVFSPSPQAFGNAGVGIVRGPGYANFDFTFAKDFRVDDIRRFQFRTESV